MRSFNVIALALTSCLAACGARSDMAVWYRSDPSRAYLSARLVDLVVATARRTGALDFELRCAEFPQDDIPENLACAPNVAAAAPAPAAAMNCRRSILILSIVKSPIVFV